VAIDMENLTYKVFILSLSEDISGFTFSNLSAGAQAIIYIANGGGATYKLNGSTSGLSGVLKNFDDLELDNLTDRIVASFTTDGTDVMMSASKFE